jgi:3-hydroxyisobutyrate dehydrogenase-like beta-hydroxyacid dehydrogenase
MDIGFIGLGAMGRPIAANLVKAGHKVRAWNRSKVELPGATIVATPREAFAGDAVLSILADDNAVRRVVVPALESAPKGLVHANLATISVAFAKELARLHADHAVGYIAATVFGRPDAAAEGKLTVVTAGEPDAVARVQPLLDAFGQKSWNVGNEPHLANVLKIAGNFLIASAMEAMAESAVLVESHGLSGGTFLEVLTGSLFAAPLYKNYSRLIVEEKYEPPAFRLALGFKDLRLCLEAAEQGRVPMPFAGVIRDQMLDALAHGDGERDWVTVARVSKRRAGRS